MRLMHEPLKLKTSETIFKALESFLKAQGKSDLLSNFTADSFYDQLVEPPQAEMGSLAFGCFIVAKNLRMGPPVIASQLVNFLKADFISGAVAAGPYINFKFTPECLYQEVLHPILTGATFERVLSEKNPRTMIEYSQPNTHKELHVGHMRNLCLGDAVVKMMKYSGVPVITSTFPGDVGTHVAKCLWYMKFHNQEPAPTENRGEWLGQMYSKAHLKLEDELGTPQETLNREILTKILHELEAKNGEFFELWKETRQWSIDLMKQVYTWAGVEFDFWYWESDVDSDSVNLAKQLFREGKLVESQGAVGLDLSEYKLGFCLLLKSDGTGLYATKDLELAKRKFEKHHIEKSIYVVDLRQALHFQQVFKTLEILGFEQAKNCFHLQYNFVELPDGAMSSRKGNIVPLMDLVQSMEEHVKTEYLARYQDEWSKEEIQSVATIVSKGAIRYGMLRQDTNKKIVFDMKEWLKLDGESGPFIQYSYARIQSILRKFSTVENFVKASNQVQPTWQGDLTHTAETQLIQHLLQFNSCVGLASENYKPSAVCTYLYELAKKFNVFYHECSVAHAETEEIQKARIVLCVASGKILKKGLELLGIPVPERM